MWKPAIPPFHEILSRRRLKDRNCRLRPLGNTVYFMPPYIIDQLGNGSALPQEPYVRWTLEHMLNHTIHECASNMRRIRALRRSFSGTRAWLHSDYSGRWLPLSPLHSVAVSYCAFHPHVFASGLARIFIQSASAGSPGAQAGGYPGIRRGRICSRNRAPNPCSSSMRGRR